MPRHLTDIFRNKKVREIIFQGLIFLAIFCLFFVFYKNLQDNLIKKNIATGFSFLKEKAGFEISESLFEYSSINSYGRALLVGLLNTLKVSLLGNFFAVLMGTFIGIFALAKNNLLRKLSKTYIEVIRNIPLLLQLFFWYAVFTEVFPGPRQSLNPMTGVFISNRGVFFPSVELGIPFLISFFLCIPLFFILRNWAIKRLENSGLDFPYIKTFFGVFLVFQLITFFLSKGKVEIPTLVGFNFEGGTSFSPEFLSLLLGLSIYTSAFVAEIVRSGIIAVSKGQEEAAMALGLSKGQTLWLVILPQAMRTIIPPLTSQFLNLTKNSSLAVAIGYPDFVSIANTTMNQTGQAVEAIILIIIVYLTFSLLTSLFMNWFNKKMALVER